MDKFPLRGGTIRGFGCFRNAFQEKSFWWVLMGFDGFWWVLRMRKSPIYSYRYPFEQHNHVNNTTWFCSLVNVKMVLEQNCLESVVTQIQWTFVNLRSWFLLAPDAVSANGYESLLLYNTLMLYSLEYFFCLKNEILKEIHWSLSWRNRKRESTPKHKKEQIHPQKKGPFTHRESPLATGQCSTAQRCRSLMATARISINNTTATYSTGVQAVAVLIVPFEQDTLIAIPAFDIRQQGRKLVHFSRGLRGQIVQPRVSVTRRRRRRGSAVLIWRVSATAARMRRRDIPGRSSRVRGRGRRRNRSIIVAQRFTPVIRSHIPPIA